MFVVDMHIHVHDGFAYVYVFVVHNCWNDVKQDDQKSRT